MDSESLYNVYVFNEMGQYFLVQVVADDSNKEEERYTLRILRHLNAQGPCPKKTEGPGNEFTVGRTKGPGGGMAGWYLREPCEVVDLAKGEGWDLTVPVPVACSDKDITTDYGDGD
jgi:hypothetical protein